MPIYDYKCPKCGTCDEVMHGIKDNPEIRCKCGEVMVRQISGGGAVIFRGAGFHCNDYAKDEIHRPPKPGEPNHKAKFTKGEKK